MKNSSSRRGRRAVVVAALCYAAAATTTMLGASRTSANRPSRVRARQLVPLTRGSRPAAGAEAPLAISAPGRSCPLFAPGRNH